MNVIPGSTKRRIDSPKIDEFEESTTASALAASSSCLYLYQLIKLLKDLVERIFFYYHYSTLSI